MPGAYDCITARMVDQAAMPPATDPCRGRGANLDFLIMATTTTCKMADNASRMTNVMNFPLIADADTGYGNELNAIRTVKEYEKRGVAAIQIEDQTFPKRCGHLDNKEVVSLDELLPKIRAAASPGSIRISPSSPAPTRAPCSGSRRRCAAPTRRSTPAPTLPSSKRRRRSTRCARCQTLKGPCLLNMVWKGKTPEVSIAEARAMGFRIMIFPGLLFKATMVASDEGWQLA